MALTVDTRSIRRRRHRSRSIQPSIPMSPSRISPHSSQTQVPRTTKGSLAAHTPRSTLAQPTTRPDDNPSAQCPLCHPLVCLQTRKHIVQPPIPTPRQATRRASKNHPPPPRPMALPLLPQPHTRLVYQVISIHPPLALLPPWLPHRTRCTLPTNRFLGLPFNSPRPLAQARPTAMVLPSSNSSNTIFLLINPWPSNPLHQPQNARRAASSGLGMQTIYDQRMHLNLLERASHQYAQIQGCFSEHMLTLPNSAQPLRALTTTISQTFNTCNPQFTYEASTNPRRVLTKPSKPAHNDGYDNEDYDYILYVNDLLGTEDGHKYPTPSLITRFGADPFPRQVPHFGRAGSGHLWPSCQVPKHQNARDRCCEGCQEQTSLLQPEYDGGHPFRDGASLHQPSPHLTSHVLNNHHVLFL